MDIRAAELEHFLKNKTALVHVEVIEVKGSAPREKGAFMLVNKQDSIGTIGGGNLEFVAIDKAKKMLIDGEKKQILEIKLGANSAQCCGGVVKINLQILDEKQQIDLLKQVRKAEKNLFHIYLFGAGHVGKAMANLLAFMPYNVTLIDSRQNMMNNLPPIIKTINSPIPETIVRDAKPNSAFVVFTHDHALDFLIVSEVLQRKDAIYVGMIGSKTKRIKFEKYFKNQGGDIAQLANVTCPIGGGVGEGLEQPDGDIKNKGGGVPVSSTGQAQNSDIRERDIKSEANSGELLVDKRPAIIAALTLSEIISNIKS